MSTPAARRRAAAVAGHTADRVTARRLCSDPDPSVRSAAIGALARLDALTHDELASALKDPDATVRRRAAEVAATNAGGSLLALLHDDDDSVVEVAAFALGERRPPEAGAVEALSAIAVEHHDPLCRESAVAALGALGDPAGLPAILSACNDKPTVRRRAVIALAPFDGPEVTAALGRARNDRDRQVRQSAEDLSAPPP